MYLKHKWELLDALRKEFGYQLGERIWNFLRAFKPKQRIRIARLLKSEHRTK